MLKYVKCFGITFLSLLVMSMAAYAHGDMVHIMSTLGFIGVMGAIVNLGLDIIAEHDCKEEDLSE